MDKRPAARFFGRYALVVGMIWLLRIGSLEVSSAQANKSPVQPTELAASFDEPARLTIRVNGDPRDYRFKADEEVTLLLDGDAVFRGLLQPRSVNAGLGQPSIAEYVAETRQAICGEILALDGTGSAEFQTQYGNVDAVVDAFLSRVTAQLPNGVANSAAYVNCANMPCLPVKFSNQSIDAALRTILAASPGCRLMFKPGVNQYQVVGIFQTPELDVSVEDYFAEGVRIAQSLKGCGGAVKTQSSKATFNQQLFYTLALNGAWDNSLVPDWILAKAGAAGVDGTPTPDSFVFRLWGWNKPAFGLQPEPSRGQPCVVEVETAAGSNLWQAVEVQEIDLDNRRVLTKDPQLASLRTTKMSWRNPRVRGYAAPARCRLKYSQSGSQTVPIGGARYPQSGFAGRAWQMAKISMAIEKRIDVPEVPGASINHALYARAVFDVISEPVTTGDVTIRGPVPIELFKLGRRINVRSRSGRLTGFEDLRAPLMGYTYSFERGGSMTLQFNSQRSAPLQGGA